MVNNNKQKVIIFEGPDCTGKTNISQRLSEIIRVPRYKNNVEKNFLFSSDSSVAAYNSFYIADFLRETKISIILDRFHISEWVYSKVFERKTKEELILEAEKILSSIGAKIIYCFKTKRDDFEDANVGIEKIPFIEFEYDNYFRQHLKCDMFKLDTSIDLNVDSQVEKIGYWFL
jgi:hypothetical protein